MTLSIWKVLYHEFVLTSKNFIRTVTQARAFVLFCRNSSDGIRWDLEVRGEWLLEIAPSYYDVRPGEQILGIRLGGEDSPVITLLKNPDFFSIPVCA
jgi:hypothetical protein